MGRTGLSELRNAVSFHSPIEAHTDPGMWGNATPGEAAAARSADDKAVESDKHSVLEERLAMAGASKDDHGKEEPGMDRE
jgi:hypothetical protein